MKRALVLVIACVVLLGLAVSCRNEVDNMGQFGDELVSISFEQKSDSSRGLSSSLEKFEPGEYYWGYAARKSANDTSNLKRGETANYGTEYVWIHCTDGTNPDKGLANNTVPGFSQGYWDFRLYAFKRSGDGTSQSPYTYSLIYEGERTGFLLKSSATNESASNIVTVTVNPISSGAGELVIKTTGENRIEMNRVNTESEYGTNYFPKVVSITSMEGVNPPNLVGTTAEIQPADKDHDGKYALPAGSYKVTFAFGDADDTVNYAKGTIVVTVYSNLTTTVAGDLTEMTAAAILGPELNPDLVTVTASNDEIVIVDTSVIKTVTLATDTSAAKEVTATIQTTDTNSIITDMATTAGTNTDAYNQKLALTLSVETVEATETTATYEIGMTAELTSIKKSDQSTTTTKNDVKNVDEYVTVLIQLDAGLTSVNVLHDGQQMVEGLDNPDPNNYGKFEYDDVSGVLTIVTKSFSPFGVWFVRPAAATYEAQIGIVKYQRLATAIQNASAGKTITLLKDVTLAAAADIDKKVTLDLAGYGITASAGLTASAAETEIKNGSISGSLTISGSDVKLSGLEMTGSVSVSGSASFDADCSVTGTGEYAINVTSTASVTIEGGTYAAASGENKYILSGNAAISDGNFKGALAPSNATGIVLSGGTYTEEQAASRIAQGYVCKKVSDDLYEVRKDFEAKNVTTGVEYYFLQDAIDAASAGDTVKLLKDITLTSGIVIMKGITLDGDSHTVTAVREDMSFADVKLWDNDDQCYYSIKDQTGLQGAFIVFSNDVSATQSDWMKTKISNLTVNATNVITVSFIQYVNGEIDHVTITSEKNRGISAGNASRESVFVKVTDCTVNESGQASPSAWNAAAVAAMCGASVEIDGGSYNGYYGIYIYSSGGKIVVNESEGKSTNITGTFNAVRHDNWANPYITEFDINGGSFDGKIALETNQPVANVRISISGGSFTHFSYQYDSFGDFITGGTFDANPSAYVVPGYVAEYDSEKTLWTVRKITEDEGVAKIVRNEEPFYFLTLGDAVDAAVAGEEVVLLKPVTVVQSIPITKNLTLNLNGKTITNNVEFNRLFRVSGVTFTVNGNGGSMIIPDDFYKAYGFVDLRDKNNIPYSTAKLVVTDTTFYGTTSGGSHFAYRCSGQSMSFTDVNVTVPIGTGVVYNGYANGLTGSLVNGYAMEVDLTIVRGVYQYETRGDDYFVFQVGNKSHVTITGATVTSNTGILESHGNVAIKDCVFVNSRESVSYRPWYNSAVAASSSANLSVDGGSYSAQNGVFAYNSGSTIGIEGGSFKGTADAVRLEADSGKESIVNIAGGDFDGSVTVEIITTGKSTLNISGGTFKNCKFNKNSSANAVISITGGTFDIDPSTYVAPGYRAIEDPAGTWTVVSSYDSGSGTATDPYIIKTATHVDSFYIDIANDNTAGVYYKLGNDVAIVGGSASAPTDVQVGPARWELTGGKKFKGNFNGDSNKIYFSYEGESETTVSLFGSIENASIHDLEVVCDIDNSSDQWVAAVCMFAPNSSFSNVTVSGLIKSHGDISGFCYAPGDNNTTVADCTVTATLTNVDGRDGTTNKYVHIGLFAAQCLANVTFDNCSYAGTVNVIKDDVEETTPFIGFIATDDNLYDAKANTVVLTDCSVVITINSDYENVYTAKDSVQYVYWKEGLNDLFKYYGYSKYGSIMVNGSVFNYAMHKMDYVWPQN